MSRRSNPGSPQPASRRLGEGSGAPPTLGSRLKSVRIQRRESLQQVADAVGVSKPHLWEIEKGRSTNPSIDLVVRIASHFRTSVSYLVGETHSERNFNAAVFAPEFQNLTDDDWDLLRQIAGRLRGHSSATAAHPIAIPSPERLPRPQSKAKRMKRAPDAG